jgi:cysteinyl-tRNA synthetase
LTSVKNLTQNDQNGVSEETSQALRKLAESCYLNMSDDFNTAKTLAALFEMSARINDMKAGVLPVASVNKDDFDFFKATYVGFMEQVLGFREEEPSNHHLLDGTIRVLIELRKKARADRNFALSDKIRDDLKAIGIQLKDGKDGAIEYQID